MRATEVAQALSRQVDAVVRELLPRGRKQGQEWRVGGISGEPGDSLGVHLGGEKAGVWSDFATGESGDLIGLWMAVKGLSLRDACTEAMQHLGITETRLDPPRRTWNKPTREGVQVLDPAHRQWLEAERKINPVVIKNYKLASRNGAIMFPYLRDGELIGAKYRKLPKSFHQDAGCEPSLFGWQAIPNTLRAIVITEGEMDALAWATYGIPALSVPMGGGTGAKHSWIESEFERLALFDAIFVSMDGDKPGQDAARLICERLGRERCRMVVLPLKDINDCLMAGVPESEIHAALRDARTLDPSELRCVSDFEDAIWQEYNRVDEGIDLPWSKTRELIKLRPGEVSVWAGVNGHGKSTVASHVCGHVAATGGKVCVASMEYRTPLWLMRMNRQIAAVEHPTEKWCKHVTQQLRGHLWAFDVQGAAKAKRIFEVFRYARRRYGIELFLLDNLTKCGFADDDYPGQKAFVEELTEFARHEETHIMLVAHMRKGESEDRPSGKFGVKGSGGVIDMADTLVEVWRNKPRERAIAEAKRTAAEMGVSDWEMPDKYRDQADTMLYVHKQRATGIEPAIRLWYDPGTTQYLSKEGYQPRAMVPPMPVGAVA